MDRRCQARRDNYTTRLANSINSGNRCRLVQDDKNQTDSQPAYNAFTPSFRQRYRCKLAGGRNQGKSQRRELSSAKIACTYVPDTRSASGPRPTRVHVDGDNADTEISTNGQEYKGCWGTKGMRREVTTRPRNSLCRREHVLLNGRRLLQTTGGSSQGISLNFDLVRHLHGSNIEDSMVSVDRHTSSPRRGKKASRKTRKSQWY